MREREPFHPVVMAVSISMSERLGCQKGSHLIFFTCSSDINPNKRPATHEVPPFAKMLTQVYGARPYHGERSVMPSCPSAFRLDAHEVLTHSRRVLYRQSIASEVIDSLEVHDSGIIVICA